jgi:DNA-binding MarR family transcriptional regulator
MEDVPMSTELAEHEVSVLRRTIVGLVRRDGPDLTARQLAVFLTCYMEDEAQTVRGLAGDLNVSKPVITRALDRLSEFDLVRRKTDPLDRRSILVQRTIVGIGFLRELKQLLTGIGDVAHSWPHKPRGSDVSVRDNLAGQYQTADCDTKPW